MTSSPTPKTRFSRPFLLILTTTCALIGLVGGCRFTSCETTRTCGEGAALGGAGGENPNLGGENGSGASSSGEDGLGGASTGGTEGSDPCNIDEIICDGECVEPLFNNDHCGATSNCRGDNAGDRCLGDEVCSEGVCSNECSGGRLNCEGSCVDPLTDERFCGATGTCAGKAESGLVCDEDEACILGECRGWTAATKVTAVALGSVLRSELSLAVNSSGDALLTWQQNNGTTSRDEVLTSHFVNSTWSQATLRNSEDDYGTFPSVTAAGAGFHMAWVEKPTASGFTRVYVDHWEEGVWVGPEQVSPSAAMFPFTGDSLETSVAADSAGNRFLAWEEGGIGGSILAQVWDSQAMSWSEFEAMGDDFGNTGSPAVAAIGDKKGLLIWTEEVDEDLVLRSCTISTASTCDAKTIHSDATLDVGPPLLVGSEAGNAAAAWIGGGGLSGPIWAIAYDSGSWQDAKSLGSGRSPRITFGGSEYAAVAFRESSTTSVVLRTSGSKWGNKQSFPAYVARSNPPGPDVAIDGQGNVVLAWIAEADDGDGDGIFVSRFEREDGRWSDPIQVATTSGYAEDVRVALTSDGLGLLTYWTENLHFAEFR